LEQVVATAGKGI